MFEQVFVFEQKIKKEKKKKTKVIEYYSGVDVMNISSRRSYIIRAKKKSETKRNNFIFATFCRCFLCLRSESESARRKRNKKFY